MRENGRERGRRRPERRARVARRSFPGSAACARRVGIGSWRRACGLAQSGADGFAVWSSQQAASISTGSPARELGGIHV
eukprot:1706860-Prymnesium_polylepis.1